ncbi:hypothetical protein RUM43_014146 [Polyplax serrata]|uniref:Proteasomal ATPase-associated factor 1 n=1 Tax=Polyplax serrata TaxID=468196 RepID=A0AAN8P1T6_POLSC
MENERKSTNNTSEIPVISLQSDWDDVIFSNKSEVWVSCKFKGKDSVHSKLKSQGLNLPICISSEFSVLALRPTSIEVRFNPTGHAALFVSPGKIFSAIHDKSILSLDLSEKGFGVSASTDEKLVVWKAATGEILRTLPGHLGCIYKCRFFPSGLVVLSAGVDMQIKIWSAETGDCPVTLRGHVGAVNDVCVVDRGRNIISVSQDGTSKLWDCGNSACLATIFETTNKLSCCTIGVYQQSEHIARKEPVNEREIGTKEKILLAGSIEGFLYGVDIYSRKKVFEIEVGSSVNVILMLSDEVIVGCQNGAIKIYKLKNVKIPPVIIHETCSPVLCGCVYKQSGFFMGRSDGSVTFYDSQNYENKRISLTGSDCDPIYGLSLLGDNILFTCCRDSKIRQYIIAEIMTKFYKNSVL